MNKLWYTLSVWEKYIIVIVLTSRSTDFIVYWLSVFFCFHLNKNIFNIKPVNGLQIGEWDEFDQGCGWVWMTEITPAPTSEPFFKNSAIG
jgi:hypothetical protein